MRHGKLPTTGTSKKLNPYGRNAELITVSRIDEEKRAAMIADESALRIEDLEAFLEGSATSDVRIANYDQVDRACEYLRSKVLGGAIVYGVNTGFGSLHATRISDDDLGALQTNLLRSHACGTGRQVDQQIVRLMLLLKVASLSKGCSGVRRETVDRLLMHIEADVLPVVYEQGSLGASGDLAPLAHLCLPLIGEGEVYFRGTVLPASAALDSLGWEPLQLEMKEGLALLNGTQFMAAHGVLSLIHARRLSHLADLIGALSLDAFGGRAEPFDALVHQVRPHPGQIASATRLRAFLANSEMLAQPKVRLQDPYSFRCMPQVHGATMDVVEFATQVVEREMNAVSDNPLIFVDEDKIISAGNFHGQPIAFALDFLAIAIAELGSISERRTYQMLAGGAGLPVYLVNKPGLNSGFMIPQYAAASIVSQNKQLCTPASVDSIVSSNGQEDHVSMGANSATKLLTVIENVFQVLAIELFTAAQALEFRRPLRSSPVVERVMSEFRAVVPFLKADDVMFGHMAEAKSFLKRVKLPADSDGGTHHVVN
ncbi:MAG: histidine ammonia-lyase [Bryobacteraceae bacterium]